MYTVLPNHSFPLGWTNLKWGLKGQLYHSHGLHPFLQVFLTTACSITCIPAHSVTVLSSIGNKKRSLHSFHTPALTRNPERTVSTHKGQQMAAQTKENIQPPHLAPTPVLFGGSHSSATAPRIVPLGATEEISHWNLLALKLAFPLAPYSEDLHNHGGKDDTR